MAIQLYNSDCIEKMQELIDKGIQVDSIVTDPPYELGFMGKSWDSTGIAYRKETWELALKLLKPGGHLLSFGGSRTYHRMAVAIEDAGFEIRDQIMWLYGSGFPKSMNIGKQIDKMNGKLGTQGKGFVTAGDDGRKSEFKQTLALRSDYGYKYEYKSEEAKQWEGWGTALKPAHEPIVMARKPLSEKTVADNVLKHGTGGINIDECRVGNEKRTHRGMSSLGLMNDHNEKSTWKPKDIEVNSFGRFPANVMHDGSEEVVSGFPNTKGSSGNGNAKVGEKSKGVIPPLRRGEAPLYNDEGSAARFFYCPKASSKERDMNLSTFKETQSGSYNFRVEGSLDGNKTNPRKNTHPTVKPIELMKYLCRLVTPKGGTVLDPFMGSGSTGIVAKKEGFNFIGIENETEYFKIAEVRISHDTKEIIETVPKDSSQVKQPSFNDLIDWSD